MPTLSRTAPRPAAQGTRDGGDGLERQWLRLHPSLRHPDRRARLTRHFNILLRRARFRRIRFHDLRHSTATLLLEQGVKLVVIKELLGHGHISVTATV
ncbi:hypothetical protein DNK56_21075 [Streptomyces sp. AC1-42W]|nr:hypothetical protein DNK56_21075 [Streptomyces sp. AC1-42W]